jgi:hypothetical protein
VMGFAALDPSYEPRLSSNGRPQIVTEEFSPARSDPGSDCK